MKQIILIMVILTGLAFAQSRFSFSGNVITDSSTGLQWRVGPDTDTSYDDALEWVNSLGGSWRMPVISELTTLYEAGIVDDDEDLVWSDEFFNTGCWVWSINYSDNSSAKVLYFWGGDIVEYRRDFGMDGRAFAVR